MIGGPSGRLFFCRKASTGAWLHCPNRAPPYEVRQQMDGRIKTGQAAAPKGDCVTLDEWLDLRDQVVSQVRRLVFLWFNSGLGSQAELSRHLGVDKSTVSRHHKALVAEKLLKPLETNQGKRNDLRSCRAQLPVENPPPALQTAQTQQPAPPTTHLLQAASRATEGGLMVMPQESSCAGEQAHQDYNAIILLFEKVNDLIYANRFTENFTDSEWLSILGSWQGVGVGIRAECDHIRRSQQDRIKAVTVDCSEIQ